jgi:hypothetical protein
MSDYPNFRLSESTPVPIDSDNQRSTVIANYLTVWHDFFSICGYLIMQSRKFWKFVIYFISNLETECIDMIGSCFWCLTVQMTWIQRSKQQWIFTSVEGPSSTSDMYLVQPTADQTKSNSNCKLVLKFDRCIE